MAKPISTVRFRHETIEKDLYGVVQSMDYAEDFTAGDGVGYSFNARVYFSIMCDVVVIRKSKFYKISCRGSAIAPAKKLKEGDRICFTGEFLKTKGHTKWFETFHVYDKSWLQKVKEIPSSEPSAI